MAAYLIADTDWKGTDRETMQRFGQAVTPVIVGHGGKFLTDRGTVPEPIEGDWQPATLMIVEFPSREAIHEMVVSPEFQAAAAIRRQTEAVFKLIVVPGS